MMMNTSDMMTAAIAGGGAGRGGGVTEELLVTVVVGLPLMVVLGLLLVKAVDGMQRLWEILASRLGGRKRRQIEQEIRWLGRPRRQKLTRCETATDRVIEKPALRHGEQR
jgi:hypothetical protein